MDNNYPKDWTNMRLGDIIQFSAGGDIDKEIFSEYKTDLHKYPIYSNALTNKGLYGYSTKYIIQKEAITITGRGDVGKTFYRSGYFTPIVRLVTGIAKYSNISIKYISYALTQIDFVNESTGVPQLTVPQVEKYTISLPPSLEEQQKIATVLSDMDSFLD